MSTLASIGRILLASLFVVSGLSKLSVPAGAAGFLASGGLPASAALALAVGLFEVVAGFALALGFKRRWAGPALAVFTLVASLIFNAWSDVAADQKVIEELLFLKNLAVAGGLLLVAST